MLKSEPAEPFTPERIVVPQQTTGRWLQLELARELGVCANIQFQQPAEFAWSMLRCAIPSLPPNREFTPDVLRWHLFALLPEFCRGEDAAAARRFLADGDARKRFELADRLAGVFDRYLNFRPDWIRDWENGATPHWQARLWRMLMEKVSQQHWVHAQQALAREIARGARPRDWPRRAFVFGVTALSPSYLQLLEQLGGGIELHVFLFNPCREYWGDILSKRQIFYRARGDTADEQHLEEGNELLAAWGRGGRDTFNALIGGGEEQEFFTEPKAGSALAAVQNDVLELRDAANAAKENATAVDDSLQIHCCHSPMREAEVLHDRLLALLETHPDIEPADILILTPDLARYGPLIAAVFEAEARIPVSLSRHQAADSPTLRAFFELLALPGTRHGVEAVLAPLDAPALRAKFGIDEDALPALRDWVGQAGIRRGVAPVADAQSPAMLAPIQALTPGRGDMSLAGGQTAAVPGNTWCEGFHRLLMGYAGGDSDTLVLGVAPCSPRGEGGFDVGEEDYATMGRFIAYCSRTFELGTRFAQARGARQWREVLRGVVDDFFDDGAPGAFREFDAARAAADEVGEIRSLIDEFAGQAGRADGTISFAVVRQVLTQMASGPATGSARLADGATIGALAPGQVLPAKIVCAVGMNGDGFPRSPPRHTFDLVERDTRRPGDRDLRHEDRYVFLEALLAARSAFLVSYSGRNQRDDSEIPPSVLVDELRDYLRIRFPGARTSEHAPATKAGKQDEQTDVAQSDGKEVEQKEVFLHQHPLQAFSARYFSGEPGWFSYSQSMRDAARILRGQDYRHDPPNRFAKKLREPEAARRTVSLNELQKFFAEPATAFLKERFGIRLGREERARAEVEALQLDNLEQWALRSEILRRTGGADAPEQGAGGADPDQVEKLLRKRGGLPHGSFGELAYQTSNAQVAALSELLRPHLETLRAKPQPFDVNIGDFRLTGVFPHVGPDHLVCWRAGSLRAEHKISIHLLQLAWIAAGNEALPALTIYLEKGVAKQKLISAPNPKIAKLEPWLEHWWGGLSQPLRFFPETSLCYAEKVAKQDANEKSDSAIEAAEKTWLGSEFSPVTPESEKPGNRLVWGLAAPREVLNADFEKLANNLLMPLASGGPKL